MEAYQEVAKRLGIMPEGTNIKEIKSGIIMACCTYEEKVGVAIGVTEKLIEKFDAVQLVKEAAEILGGKGGGGRKDFAQAGGQFKDKIDEAFEKIKTLI